MGGSGQEGSESLQRNHRGYGKRKKREGGGKRGRMREGTRRESERQIEDKGDRERESGEEDYRV